MLGDNYEKLYRPQLAADTYSEAMNLAFTRIESNAAAYTETGISACLLLSKIFSDNKQYEQALSICQHGLVQMKFATGHSVKKWRDLVRCIASETYSNLKSLNREEEVVELKEYLSRLLGSV